jgi:putative addiction module component (TIGR02574 family)
MPKAERDLESRALKLPRRQRARLAQRLISSLDSELSADDVDDLWLQEAARRLRELKSGQAAGIPAANVMRKARSTLREKR